MASATKREAAQRVLDAEKTAALIPQRIIIGGVVSLLLAGAIFYLTRWEFGLAALLVFGLLLQFAAERMGVIIDASRANGLKDLGWDTETELTEEVIEKIRKISQG